MLQQEKDRRARHREKLRERIGKLNKQPWLQKKLIADLNNQKRKVKDLLEINEIENLLNEIKTMS